MGEEAEGVAAEEAVVVATGVRALAQVAELEQRRQR